MWTRPAPTCLNELELACGITGSSASGRCTCFKALTPPGLARDCRAATEERVIAAGTPGGRLTPAHKERQAPGSRRPLYWWASTASGSTNHPTNPAGEFGAPIATRAEAVVSAAGVLPPRSEHGAQ